MNIWEHQALVAAGKLVADAAPGVERTALQVEKDIAAHVAAKAQTTSSESFMEKAVHAVEHALHIGSPPAETAEPQAPASAPQAPVAAPQAQDRKAALLAELHKLEDDIQHLGD